LSRLFKVTSASQFKKKSTSSVSLCPEHNDQERLFCITCQKSICLFCHNFGAHKGHNADLSQNLTNKAKTELQKLLQNIKENNKKLEEISTHLGTTVQTLNRDSEKITQEINDQTEKLILLVQRRRTELINLVEEHMKKDKVPLQQNQQIIGDVFAQGVALKEEMIILLKKDDLTILHSVNTLQQKTETHLTKSNDNKKNVVTPPQSIKIKFDTNNCVSAIQNFGDLIDQERERAEQMREQERRRAEEMKRRAEEQKQQQERERAEEQIREQERRAEEMTRRQERTRAEEQRQQEERKREEEQMQQGWKKCQKCGTDDVVGRFHLDNWRFKDNKWQCWMPPFGAWIEVFIMPPEIFKCCLKRSNESLSHEGCKYGCVHCNR